MERRQRLLVLRRAFYLGWVTHRVTFVDSRKLVSRTGVLHNFGGNVGMWGDVASINR